MSATQRYGDVPQRHYMEFEDQKVVLALGGLNNFKHVQKNDFVISLRSFQGGIEYSAFSGCVSPAYTVLRAAKSICPRYYAYTLKSEPYIAALQSATDGIRDGKNISYEQFGTIPLPAPPLPEQRVIASLRLEFG
ncbi:restriction endonuclease subunit S [Microvirga sp. 3-52]|nr:restriction endonuclease subunit S [Microvirga sp. 3-52]MBS7455144.1 restriction endonuclease subunit S [Microvirga sp. 3-52]